MRIFLCFINICLCLYPRTSFYDGDICLRIQPWFHLFYCLAFKDLFKYKFDIAIVFFCNPRELRVRHQLFSSITLISLRTAPSLAIKKFFMIHCFGIARDRR